MWSTLTFKIKVKILKIVKLTQPLDRSQRLRSRSTFWTFHQAYSKLIKISFKALKLSSPKSSSILKMLVNNLTSMEFIRGRSLIKDIIQTSQNPSDTFAPWFKFYKKSSDSEPTCLLFEFERLILMSSHGEFRSYVLSFLEIVII